MDEGLKILESIRKTFGLPVLTDVHEDTRSPRWPPWWMFCRHRVPVPADQLHYQHRLPGKPVNIKKGQFLSPWEMKNVVDKARSTGNEGIMVCERGFSFGYNNLVSDMRSLSIMRDTKCPVVFDATHSVQLPGGQGDRLRRPARVHPRAGSRRRGIRRRRPLHGNAPRPRPRRSPTAPTPGRCTQWKRSWRRSRRSTWPSRPSPSKRACCRRRTPASRPPAISALTPRPRPGPGGLPSGRPLIAQHRPSLPRDPTPRAGPADPAVPRDPRPALTARPTPVPPHVRARPAPTPTPRHPPNPTPPATSQALLQFR